MFNTEFPFNLENGSHYMPISPARMGCEKIFIRAPQRRLGRLILCFTCPVEACPMSIRPSEPHEYWR